MRRDEAGAPSDSASIGLGPRVDVARPSGAVSERVVILPAAARVDLPTRRRAGVFRRALRHEVNRIRDPRRLPMMVLLGFVGGFVLACLLARGEAAGADTRAYWAAGRLWLSGGDPYHPTGPFMPYVYSPWMLPLFVPWSILPWDVAWFVWRGATVIGLLWSVHWAYKRRPMTTAILLVLLAFPMAANLDTGNINLPLALLLFGAQFCGPRMAGLLWMVATTVKWVPAVFWPFMSPRGRLWGLAWLLAGRAADGPHAAADAGPAPGPVLVPAAAPGRLPRLRLGPRAVGVAPPRGVPLADAVDVARRRAGRQPRPRGCGASTGSAARSGRPRRSAGSCGPGCGRSSGFERLTGIRRRPQRLAQLVDRLVCRDRADGIGPTGCTAGSR